jgi:hypothetical protein
MDNSGNNTQPSYKYILDALYTGVCVLTCAQTHIWIQRSQNHSVFFAAGLTFKVKWKLCHIQKVLAKYNKPTE